MKKRIFSWIKDIIFIFITVAIGLNVISYLNKPELESTTLPKFQLQSIENKQINSDDFSNKALIIHFWATWCPACKVEAPNIQSISKSAQVITVAVNSGSDDELKSFLKKRGYDFVVINDPDGKLASRFSVPGYPTTFIYDKNGEISSLEVGYTSTLGLKIRHYLANK